MKYLNLFGTGHLNTVKRTLIIQQETTKSDVEKDLVVKMSTILCSLPLRRFFTAQTHLLPVMDWPSAYEDNSSRTGSLNFAVNSFLHWKFKVCIKYYYDVFLITATIYIFVLWYFAISVLFACFGVKSKVCQSKPVFVQVCMEGGEWERILSASLFNITNNYFIFT